MNKELIILKLGGAAITDKNKPFTERNETIKLIFDQLEKYDGDIILIHGAGSFAHTLAKDYEVAHGYQDSLDKSYQIEGVSKIRNSMQRLHQILLDQAEKVGLHTFSIPISSTLITNGQEEFDDVFLKPFDHALKNEFIPVSYGDISFDTGDKGFLVVSGDRIIKILAEHYRNFSIRVIFGTDVDGLYDKDPKFDDAKLLDNIKFSQIEQWLEVAGESSGVDVTGGMEGKLRQILKISQFVDQIDIINLTVPNRLIKCLKSENNYTSTTFHR